MFIVLLASSINSGQSAGSRCSSTSGKHDTFMPTAETMPAHERIGDWEFFRTPKPTGLDGPAAGSRRACDHPRSGASARRDHSRGPARYPACALPALERIAGDSRRAPASVCRSFMRSGVLGGCQGELEPRRQARPALSRNAASRDVCDAARRRGYGHLRGTGPRCHRPRHFDRKGNRLSRTRLIAMRSPGVGLRTRISPESWDWRAGP